MQSLAAYLPDVPRLLGLFATFAVVLAFQGLGAFAGGANRWREADLLIGWAVAAVLFTVVGTLVPAVPFSLLAWPMFGIAGLAAWRAWRRDRAIVPADAGKVLVLVTPLLLLVAAAQPSQWDEFSQWLWSAKYLFQVDGFPGPGRPVNPASYPAYPYTLPLVTYLASRLSGLFVETAGAVFNILLLAAFALTLVRLIEMGAGQPVGRLGRWGLVGFGLLAATLLSPTFVRKLVFTAYAEVGTMVALGLAGLLGWLVIEALAEGNRATARARAWQCGLALMMVVGLKQGNLALLLILPAAIGLAGLRRPGVAVIDLFRLGPLVLVPPVVFFVLWKWYSDRTGISSASMSILPMADWAIGLIPTILAKMAVIALKKAAFFLPMLVLAGLALRGLWRYRDPFHGLAIIAGLTFLGYNAFLFLAYVIVFGGYDAENVLSYWRYNTHLGGLLLVAATYGLAQIAARRMNRRPPAAAGLIAVVLILVLPVALIDKVRFDLHPVKVYVRAVAEDMRRLLPPGARITMIDPTGNGFYPLMLRYLIHPVAEEEGRFTLFDQVGIEGHMKTFHPTHAWVHSQSDAVRAYFRLPLPQGASYLLEAAPEGWAVVKSWPYPGYDDPSQIPDK